jgi:hypothetical protein
MASGLGAGPKLWDSPVMAPAPIANQGGRFGIPTDIFSNPDYGQPLAQAPAYQAPAPNPAPATPSYGIGTPDSGGYGGAAQPAPQSTPVQSEPDWLAGDGDYQNQLSQYGTALSDFLARLTRQKSDFTNDYNTAKTGLDRNEQQGLQNIGEDFTSRGLANSGLFADSRQKAQQNFTDQRTGMNTARDRAMSDFSTQEADKRASTQQAQDNAKRASLGRMSQNQMF